MNIMIYTSFIVDTELIYAKKKIGIQFSSIIRDEILFMEHKRKHAR